MIVQIIIYFIYLMIITKLINFIKYENQSLEQPTKIVLNA